jgi:hypothetical protein
MTDLARLCAAAKLRLRCCEYGGLALLVLVVLWAVFTASLTKDGCEVPNPVEIVKRLLRPRIEYTTVIVDDFSRLPGIPDDE